MRLRLTSGERTDIMEYPSSTLMESVSRCLTRIFPLAPIETETQADSAIPSAARKTRQSEYRWHQALGASTRNAAAVTRKRAFRVIIVSTATASWYGNY